MAKSLEEHAATRLLTCVRPLRIRTWPDLPTIGCGPGRGAGNPETAGLTFEVISGDTSIAGAVAALIPR